MLKLSVIAAAVLVGIFAYSTQTTLAEFASSNMASAAGNASPKSLYNANCARCHGADGHANTPKGREMDADDLTSGKAKGMSAATMSRIIKNGKGDMPGFKKLTAIQVSQIVGYVKSL